MTNPLNGVSDGAVRCERPLTTVSGRGWLTPYDSEPKLGAQMASEVSI